MGDVQFQIFEGFKSDQQRFVRYGRRLTWDLSFEERYLGSDLWNWNAIDDLLTVFVFIRDESILDTTDS